MIVPMQQPYKQNAENFQRSAKAPVGIVAVVSMNTIWNRKVAATAGVNMAAGRKNPLAPKSPHSLPPTLMLNSCASEASPPNVASGPTPPICSPKPSTQNPMMPMGGVGPLATFGGDASLAH